MNNILKILLCAPRGFCAGVDRAVDIVEKSLENSGLLFMLGTKLFIINTLFKL